MKSKVEKVEKNVVKFEIEVDADKFDEGMEKSFKKNAGKFNIPGFRKGKAPRKIIERYYGEQVLYEDAINFICPETYDQAVKEHNINPVDRPDIDIVQIGNGQDLIFTAKVTVKPEVELGEYKGIEAEKKEVIVTDDDVEKELKESAEKNSRLVNVEDRAVQEGDTAVIDFEGFVDGEAFEGGEGKNYFLTIGSGQFIPGFEEQLIGVEKGNETEVNVVFPEDYSHEKLAGKAALFKVTVNEIKVKEIPAIDDEFAQDVSEFSTLEEYKADLRKKLFEKEEHTIKHELEDSVIKKVVENANVDIPDVMVNERINYLLSDIDMRLRYQGMNLDNYLKAVGEDIDSFKEQFSERARNEVKTQLVLEKIKDVEGIKAEDSEFDEEIRKFAENDQKNEEEFKKQLTEDDIEYIRNNITVAKTINFLVNNAKLV
ncbi:MAG TPA: trigger factor [Clostridiales bacterium]|nr:trigger factor [Clostridiales bacterium]